MLARRREYNGGSRGFLQYPVGNGRAINSYNFYRIGRGWLTGRGNIVKVSRLRPTSLWNSCSPAVCSLARATFAAPCETAVTLVRPRGFVRSPVICNSILICYIRLSLPFENLQRNFIVKIYRKNTRRYTI